MKYRKKPIVIDACRVPQVPIEYGSFRDWADEAGFVINLTRGGCMTIETLEGMMLAEPGDYIIKGIEGEFYPCRTSIFEATYELVEK